MKAADGERMSERRQRLLTVVILSAMINMLRNKEIEVACFKSSFSDVSGTDEEKGKGNAPKDKVSMNILSWAYI